MIKVCAWCDRYLGLDDPTAAARISHTICPICQERWKWPDRPTLVVSRKREDLVPVLEKLFQGIPEIVLVVDRRRGERRSQQGQAATRTQRRRQGDRRRTGPSMTLQ